MRNPFPPTAPECLSRRDLLTGVAKGVGVGVVAAPLARLLAGCGSDSDGGTADTGTADTGAVGADTTADGWLIGGTAGMSGDYRDPFTPAADTCALSCAMTLGPCYAETLDRRDISEGYPGLPVRLAFQVVNDACEPVPDAIVDIWHTRNTGLYSGPDAFIFCTADDADAKSHQYFRGTQTTDADGRVDFDTCFPGWYVGRTIHIHFRIVVGTDEHVVSQLFFPQSLTEQICGSHPDYASRGQPDTENDDDSVLGDAPADAYLFEWSKEPDGAMLAWKRLVIRSSLATTLCEVGDSGGPGG